VRAEDAAPAARPVLPNAPTDCSDGIQPSGAAYRICMPAVWNGILVIYAHGYVAPNEPIGLPEDQLSLPGAGNIADVVNFQGLAFAASSYRVNGLAVEEGISDTLELLELFTRQQGRPRKVLLTGVSEGAVVTALALERYPHLFDAGLALCGPIGDFQRQVNYLGDFRVAFDAVFSDSVSIPNSAMNVDPALLDSWESVTYSTTVKPVLEAGENLTRLMGLLNATGAAFVDPLTPTVTITEPTVERLLWYSVFATNDIQEKLGGQPYGNSSRVFTDVAGLPIDGLVARYTADVTATNAISANLETRGVLGRPFTVVHTTDDPLIPYWHATVHQSKVLANSTIDPAINPYRLVTVPAYGHCAFPATPVLLAFDELIGKIDTHELYLSLVAQ
jgi:pimeloyl-ACP methyl ester carboxylesterase